MVGDYYVDEFGNIWFVGEEMEIWFCDWDGWYLWDVVDTTDVSDGEIKLLLSALDRRAEALGLIGIDVSFHEFLY